MSEIVDVYIVNRLALYEVNAGAPLLELVRVKGTRTKKKVRIPSTRAWSFYTVHDPDALSYTAGQAFNRFELNAFQRINAAKRETDRANADLVALASLRQLLAVPRTEEDR